MGLRGKIDGNGHLSLERPRKKTVSNVEAWRAVYCPSSQAEARCGDWCPHFGEPTTANKLNGREPAVSLRLCWGTSIGFLAGEFTDERSE